MKPRSIKLILSAVLTILTGCVLVSCTPARSEPISLEDCAKKLIKLGGRWHWNNSTTYLDNIANENGTRIEERFVSYAIGTYQDGRFASITGIVERFDSQGGSPASVLRSEAFPEPTDPLLSPRLEAVGEDFSSTCFLSPVGNKLQTTLTNCLVEATFSNIKMEILFTGMSDKGETGFDVGDLEAILNPMLRSEAACIQSVSHSVLSGSATGNPQKPLPTSTILPSIPVEPTTVYPANDILTPTYPLTLSPAPTPAPDEANMRLRSLLTDSTQCRMPCWLGITPGISTWQDANDQLAYFSSIARRLGLGKSADQGSFGDLSIPNSDNTIIIEVSASYMTSNTNTISVAGMRTRSYKVKNGEYDGDLYGYPAYNELLKNYTLSGVLSIYGPPDKVLINADLRSDNLPDTPGYGDDFKIHLWYPEQGIFLDYRMPVEGSGKNYRFCSSDSAISGHLLPPGVSEKYQEETLPQFETEYSTLFSPSEFVKTPEEAFGITIEEFY